MMSEEADTRASEWAARPWRALRGLNDRTSLRTKLITALLVLVAAAVAAMSISSALVLRSYLTSQDDGQLQSVFDYFDNNPFTFVPGQANVVHGTNILVGVQQPGVPLSLAGTPSGLPYAGNGQPQSLPEVPTNVLWTDTHSGKLVTVAAQSGSHMT